MPFIFHSMSCNLPTVNLSSFLCPFILLFPFLHIYMYSSSSAQFHLFSILSSNLSSSHFSIPFYCLYLIINICLLLFYMKDNNTWTSCKHYPTQENKVFTYLSIIYIKSVQLPWWEEKKTKTKQKPLHLI